MRRLLTVMMLLALFVVAAVPTLAQEDSNTIADIVVASASAEEAEFTTLLTAVQAADPAVLELLSNPEAQLTVFAPTDAAFAALAEALGEEAFNAVLEDPALLTAILQYHVVPGAIASADVVTLLENNAALEESMEETEGDEETEMMEPQPLYISTARGLRAEITQTEDGGITVGGAALNLDMLDIQADNGVVHVINDVMVPPLDTIADVVVASTEGDAPEFTTLLAAVGEADPAILDLLSNPLASVTVFAPTDAAFEAVGEETLNTILADTELLTGILQYHVLPGVAYESDIAAVLADEGAIEISMADGNTALLEVTEDGAVTIAGATVVTTDIETLNGVVHVIDAVILPPEA